MIGFHNFIEEHDFPSSNAYSKSWARFHGSIDSSFAFRKETSKTLEDVEAFSPSIDIVKGYTVIYVSYLGSYDTQNTSAFNQRMRPFFCI